MALSFLARSLVCSVALASALSSAGAQAAHQKSWAERLGLISYEPLEQFYEDYEMADSWHSEDGPLLLYLPKSARNIYVTISKFQDLVIAEYIFDKNDQGFLETEWKEITEPHEIEQLLDLTKTCPWRNPAPKDARYFESAAHKYWGLSSYMIVDESRLAAWYYWSVPQPTRGSFCI